MIHRAFLTLSTLAAFAAAFAPSRPAAAAGGLDGYFQRPEPAYKWVKRGEVKRDGCTIYDLQLVSQVWQGITWSHRLQIFRPDKLTYPGFCAIYNTGGNGSEGNTQMGLLMARNSGAVYAMLFGIPNQPLYGGKTEDALVVHTWLKYMETGDDTWPLHFPMAKAVLKSMDAIQEFTKQSGQPEINGFLVSGASKRGWTTWLAGASRDPRIKGIIPMVIDVLNVRKQGPHQKEAYGKFSEQIADYTRVNMMERLETPEGRKLMELEDPYSYRHRLTMPKLLILGTNDRYWSQDALNLYWDGLKGPKWVLYTPNSGHGLEDRPRVFATMAAFIRMVAGGTKWPKMQWSYRDRDAGSRLSLRSDIQPKEARLFHVGSATRDFRDSRWSYEQMSVMGKEFFRQWPAPAEGYNAIFGEAVYDLDGQPFTLSTQIRILGPSREKATQIAR
jgi:PhoPQ-activated pathogenicity-related protein